MDYIRRKISEKRWNRNNLLGTCNDKEYKVDMKKEKEWICDIGNEKRLEEISYIDIGCEYPLHIIMQLY